MDLTFWIAAAVVAAGVAAGFAAAYLFHRRRRPDPAPETQDDFTASAARWRHLRDPRGDW
jgi:hypothetical protein